MTASKWLALLTTVWACGGQEGRATETVASASPGSAVLTQLDNVRIGMTAAELRAARRAATEAPYAGLSETRGDTAITYYFPSATDAPVAASSSLSGAAAVLAFSNQEAAGVHLRAIATRVRAALGEPVRCIGSSPAATDSISGLEFRTGAKTLALWVSVRSSAATARVTEMLSSDSMPLARRPCPAG